MPSNKFFGKSKEDLVLLATLGRVLTPQQAKEMSQTDLAAYLYSMDQEVEANRSTAQITLDREKTPLMKRQTGINGKPTDKLSKKELNKQKFLLELAAKGSDAIQADATTVPDTVQDAGERTNSVKKSKAAKAVKASELSESSAASVSSGPSETSESSAASAASKTSESSESSAASAASKTSESSESSAASAASKTSESSESSESLQSPKRAKTSKVEKASKVEKIAKATKIPKIAKASKSSKSSKAEVPIAVPIAVPMSVPLSDSPSDSTLENTSNITSDSIQKTTKIIIIPAIEPKRGRTKKNAPSADIQVVADLPKKRAVRSARIRVDNDLSAENMTVDVPESAAADMPEPAIATVIPDSATAPAGETGGEIPARRKPRTTKRTAKGVESTAKEPLPENQTAVQGDEAVNAKTERLSDSDAPVAKAADSEATPEQPIRHHRPISKIPADSPEEAEGDATAADEGDKRKHEKITQPETLEIVEGALEIMPDGYGFLRKFNYLQGPRDIYIPPQYIRRFGLRPGDWISGPGKLQRETDRYQAILYIKEVNGLPPEKMIGRPQFDQLTPIYPDVRYVLETVRNELSTRIIDLVAPIGKGQRGMIVSPPKAGKTILLQKIANAIATNNPEAKLIVLLIDERPEEVTDMQRSIHGEVVYSTFDKTPENHVKIVELVLERAMRLVELGQDVVILLDSITRLARAYNLTINPTGRTLSGGLDPGALYGPKRFFGSARNIENGGSLTIIATSLIDTGSRMDEVIFEEFKGTGNMEVYLDRKLSEKRIFPAIDLNRSGTRREELLLSKRELDAVWTIRKAFGQMDTSAVTEMIINLLLKTNNNSHFVSSVNVSLNDKAMFDAMRGPKPSGSGNQGNGGGQGSGGYGNSYGNGSSSGN